jgi:FkbM family methyltransferase
MQILKPGSTFIDVGGNVGLHTLFASSIVGTGGQVHTFEPLPHLFKTLELNVDVNGAGRTITTYQQAVSDSVGTASFSNFRTHSAMSGFTIPDERLECFREDREQSIELLTVNTTTLDAMFPGKVVDGLKVDVEGYEALVIRGARDLIKANSEVKIILEWDPDLVGKTVGEAKSEEMIYFLRSENFIPYLALWQKPLRRIEWDDAAAVRGDLILSRTPLRT